MSYIKVKEIIIMKNEQKKNGAVNIANKFAKATLICTANSACMWAIHQPKVPQEVRKFRKF